MPFKIFRPILAGARPLGRIVACIGAVLGIALTIVVCRELPIALENLPIIVAPLGASAVLVFAVPANPLALPRSVVGGHTLSALVGVLAFQTIPSPAVAAGAAVGGGNPSSCRSAAACTRRAARRRFTAVIGTQDIHAAGYFAFAPVALNSIALVSLAMFFYRFSEATPTRTLRSRWAKHCRPRSSSRRHRQGAGRFARQFRHQPPGSRRAAVARRAMRSNGRRRAKAEPVDAEPGIKRLCGNAISYEISVICIDMQVSRA